MEITLSLVAISILVFFGLSSIWSAKASGTHSAVGRKALAKMRKWQKTRIHLWDSFPLRKLLELITRVVFVDEATSASLGKKLSKAELPLTPREYTARKYLILAFGALPIGICMALKFYIGVVLGILATAYLLMKQRDALDVKIKQKDLLIAQEMPRFVRTICRNLQSNRDLFSVIKTYRKVAGAELAVELDILLAEMQAGNMQNALAHFESRIGTPEAFRLCAALRDMSMGVDQTATLDYLADSMASQAKENIRRELSLRPGKMRRTYYPAIGICIAIIMYVLVNYVINNLNNII
ncbi:MAG: hypothetical protein RSE64_06110 [Oscillospiraceae bacterium]